MCIRDSLAAFEEALAWLVREHPQGATRLLADSLPLWEGLMARCLRGEEMKAAYLAFVLAKYRVCAGRPCGALQEGLFALLGRKNPVSYTHLVTLVSLTVMTAMVMTVIGNNIAMSLGMVGALSIVRFRTAIKDSRDTAYIFWTIIVGICCGAGDYLVASVGSAVVFLVLLVLGRLRNDNRQVLIIRAGRAGERKIEALVFSHFERKALLRVKNTTEQSVEFIYELTRRTLEGAEKVHGPVTDALYALGGVEYVNVVSQNDEITG